MAPIQHGRRDAATTQDIIERLRHEHDQLRGLVARLEAAKTPKARQERAAFLAHRLHEHSRL